MKLHLYNDNIGNVITNQGKFQIPKDIVLKLQKNIIQLKSIL